MRKSVIEWFAGKKRFQSLFETLYRASLYGMNYGNGDVRQSGETYATKYVKSKLSGQAKPYILFDVGANQGKYTTRLAGTFADTDFRIHAFEPSKQIFDVFNNNTKQLSHITSHQFGFGSKQEHVVLHKRAALSGHASVYNRRLEHFDMALDIKEEIELKTLDQFCAEQGIGHIHFLKMDVEGHEWHCLQGASGMIEKGAIDFIQFEFGGCNIDSRTFFQDFWYLLNDKYHFFRVLKDGLQPIDAYNERLEIFKNINFLLQRKTLQ